MAKKKIKKTRPLPDPNKPVNIHFKVYNRMALREEDAVREICIVVESTPIPQGRIKVRMSRGKVSTYYSNHDEISYFRGNIEDAIRKYARVMRGEFPIIMEIAYFIEPPYSTRRQMEAVKDNGFDHPSMAYFPAFRRPDIDNYDKGVLDAVTKANVWEDDGRIIFKKTGKFYTLGKPRVAIRIIRADKAQIKEGFDWANELERKGREFKEPDLADLQNKIDLEEVKVKKAQREASLKRRLLSQQTDEGMPDESDPQSQECGTPCAHPGTPGSGTDGPCPA